MVARGTPVDGWWAYWPFHGENYARRFGNEEDAIAYIPNTHPKKGGLPYPLGQKWVMHVVWDYDTNGWTYHDPIIFSQADVERQLKEGEAA